MKILVSFSGGKDSGAALVWAVEQYGSHNIEAVFCDTKWEHEDTYIYLDYLTKALGVKLTVLTSKKYDGFIDLAKKKKRFPSTKARFCTEELKVKPMIDYVLTHSEHLIIVQGIRGSESAARSLMSKQCTFFKYYFEPYTSNQLVVDRLSMRNELTPEQRKKLNTAKERLAAGYRDEKRHTYRSREVKEWRQKYNDDIIRPFFDATGQDVVDYVHHRGLYVNPLYARGFKRVGCFPCIMATKHDIKMISKDQEYSSRLINAENEVGGDRARRTTFFNPTYIPFRARTGFDAKTGKRFPTAVDVFRYIADSNATLDLFDEHEPRACMSFYNICE